MTGVAGTAVTSFGSDFRVTRVEADWDEQRFSVGGVDVC